ncbi:BCCT family transporter [Corynebacterium zhongnanshanii]|uniref:BCCT family transporter n=1 Tax=Corynebacterium zhongnanshanii TaxID=2768834 RepID=A0ABQ6VHQ5_9CORY|nr:choline BCCT transporter BetT [Corynebacterium zhongnanshanii]KAB3523323.1 BCCT family transporter [Corynebacterium zhongnanshanii]
MSEKDITEEESTPHAIVGTVSEETAGEAQAHENKPNWVVVGFTAVFTIAVSIWAYVSSSSFEHVVTAATGWLTGNLGWLYVGTVAIVLGFMVWIAVSSAGNIRLGPDHSRPQYSLFSWSAMLFAAGIGIGILFYSVAEPIAQYVNPPVGEGQSQEALQNAVVWTLFHYGISGWALYALMGLAFGYYAYRLNMPLAIRSALYPIIGKRIHGPVGEAVDVVAMLGTIFGVAASLGIGVVQLNFGLNLIFDLPENVGVQIALIVLAIGVATLSAVSGVDKGIKRLSEINVYLASALLVIILVTGRTGFLLDSLVKNMGDYLYKLPLWSFETFSYSHTPEATQQWMSNWTLFFWAWWVAWAPFVGLFLARISRGRTFRQFIIGTLIVPFLFLALWASFLGNAALDRVQSGDRDFLEATVNSPERGFYMMLQDLPLGTWVIVLALVTGMLFFVTSADSGALVMAKFSSTSHDPQHDGAPWMRILWSVSVGVLTIAMLQVDGISTLQMATLIVGMPFMIVIFLIMLGLVRSIRREKAQLESRAVALHSAISGRTGGVEDQWEERLDRSVSFPDADESNEYIRTIAAPALEDVARALEERDYQPTLLIRQDTETCVQQLDLSVPFGEDPAFRYQLFPLKHDAPGFHPGEKSYIRLEVFGMNGSLGYDVNGYTKKQLISNVLDLFDRHLEYLHMQKDFHGASDLSEYQQDAPEWNADFGTQQ